MTTPHKAILIQARDALADHAMDAPVTDTPKQIVKSIIAMAVTMATNSTIAAGAVRSIPKGIRRKLLDELGAELECADGDEWDDAVVTMVENYLAAGAAPVPCVVLTPEDRAAFERFHETWEDNEGYDVPKEMMRRLAEVGVVHHITAGRYDITKFGHYVLAAGAEPVPEGWQLVPVEPTDAMLVSARDWSYAKYGKPIGNAAAVGCWEAMLSAAAKDARTKETK